MKRKLTAIFSADAKSYSRLMGEDEMATVRTLTGHRQVMTTLIEQHHGRVVDSPGDNLLAEFASAVDAVRCAVEIQRALKLKNAELPPERRMEFRIGINVGDVIVEGERIYGDGVNIAARLEGLAEPGGICISGTVYDQIANKLALGYEYLGEQMVKNIAQPVRVYRGLIDGTAAPKEMVGAATRGRPEPLSPGQPHRVAPTTSSQRRWLGMSRRRIRDLRKYGLPDTLLQIWEQQQGEFLLPVQEVAVQRYSLFEGRSLVISSPTSSGKTFIGEMAAMRATFAGKRVLYLTPLRALAEEKYQTFRARYGAYGVKVVVATRDRREFDRDIEQGDFHLAVLVYEKLSQLLVRHPHLLRSVALVVVDELQMLGDPERGPGLELSLAKLLASEPRPQLLGLSAVLREAQPVADWLEADLLFQDERPVELYRGVLLGDRFRYKAYNSGEEDEEQLATVDSEDPREILFANVKHLVERGEQVLIFLKGKRDTVQCALALAETLALPPAQEALAALEPLEETALKAQLRTAFAGGVAFHHADLTPDERTLVETYYRNGELRVIACTTTLAFGVNLPATTVFIEAVKWDTDERSGAALEVPLSWAEYENISGRAGRLGFQEEFGRSILIATNQFQADLLWSGYVMGEQEQFTPAPGQEGLADRVLNLIASKVCISKDELQAFFALTYLGFQQRGKTAALLAEIEKALDALVRTQLVIRSEDGRLEASTLGEVAARKGIRAATAVKLARFFESARGREVPELELFYLLSLTEEGKKTYLPLSTVEHRSRVYESKVSEQVHESGTEPGEELGRLLNSRMLPTAQEARSAKLALLLLGWTKGDELSGLESRYQCYAGTIMTLTDEVSWLVDAAAEIAEVMGWTPAKQLAELAERVRFGVDPAGLALARASLAGLSREDIKSLSEAGFDSPAALRGAPPEVLERYLSPAQIQALRMMNAE